MTKRIVLGISICAVLAVALVVVHSPVVKASGGSFCFAPCSIPPVSTCAGGGTNPLPGGGTYQPVEPAQGNRAYYYIPHVANCAIFVNNLTGSLVGTNPSGIEVTTFGAWASTDTSCNPANNINPLWVARTGISSGAPAQYMKSATGTVLFLSGNTGICVGFDATSADIWQGVNLVYGYF
jgi:hypothetical protein